MKTITFNNTTLEVVNTPYQYLRTDGDTILKLEFASSEVNTFDAIFGLTENASDIIYKEDGKVVNRFINFTCGEEDFICNYSNKAYVVEIKQKSVTDSAVEKLNTDTISTEEAIAELYEMVLELQMQLAALSGEEVE